MKLDFKEIKNTVIDNFKKNKYILLGFFVVFVSVIVFTLVKFNATLGKLSVGNESYNRSVVEVNSQTMVEQIAPVEQDAESVSILFATYARPTNSGLINIKIEGLNSKTVYANQSYDVTKILDNFYETIVLSEKLSRNKDRQIKITITSNSQVGSGIAVYYSNTKEFNSGDLRINNEVVEEADMCVKYLVHNDELHGFSIGVIVWSIIGLFSIALLLLLFNPKEEVLFAYCAFVLGLIMMVIINPSSPPDELSHYEVALQVSNKMMFTENYRVIDSIYLKYGYMYGHYNISPGYIRFIHELNQPLKLTGQLQELSRDIDGLYIIQYIPNAIGLTLGRILKLNMITNFYLGRMTGLLFYVACVYLAIKKASTFKFLIGMLSCLPMFIQIAISISYDVFINGLSILIIGYFLSWYFEERKIEIKEFIFVFLVCFGIAPAKVLYSFFAFLFLFVPYRKFGSVKNKVLMCIVIMAPGVYQLFDIMKGPIQLFFHYVLKNNSDNLLFNKVNAETINEEAKYIITNGFVTPNKEIYTFSYMIKHPIETLMIFLRTIRYKIKFWFYGSIGRSLSGDTLLMPLWLVHILVAIVFASAFVKEDYTFGIGMKAVLLIMCVVIGLYALIGMFVSWTDSNQEIIEDYGGIIIEGIQGRYFSPLLPFFFPIFNNNRLFIPKEGKKYILFTYLILFFVIVINVLSYTFVN